MIDYINCADHVKMIITFFSWRTKMRILQFLNITHNTLRIGLVSHIGQRRHLFFTRKIFNFEQTVRQATNFRTCNSYNSKVEFNSLSASKVSITNENDAVISTFDLFSIGIGPSSRFVTVTL